MAFKNDYKQKSQIQPFSLFAFLKMIEQKYILKEKQIKPEEPEENHSVLRKVCDFSLNQLRHSVVFELIKTLSIKRVLDVGCNSGQLIKMLSRSPKLELIAGIDCDQQSVLKSVSNAFPEMIQSSIQFDRESDLKVLVFKGDLAKKSYQLRDLQFEAITMIEVIEHLRLDVVPQASQILFGFMKPPYVIITTPNKEFNVHFGSDPNKFRHWDHKFEWTRKEFKAYCESIKQKYSYNYQLQGIGEHVSDPSLGCCTQMAIFTLQIKQQEVKFQGAQSVEKYQFSESSLELQMRADYTISCWKSKRSEIMLNLFYGGISYQTEQTFEKLLDYIKVASLLTRSMQKNGEQLDLSYLKQSIFQFGQFFEWDQEKYWAKQIQADSINFQQIQHQRELQQFMADIPYRSFPQLDFEISQFKVIVTRQQSNPFQEVS